MKIGRQYVGKLVEIVWQDPTFTRIEFRDMRKGRAALSTWKEYGIILDVTDGVVLIGHSAASMAGSNPDETDEIAYTPVPEAIIEKITVFEPIPALRAEGVST